ncbi:50S ribosomal protein L29 [Patescibacteria group bacterium]|nr:50S ribosomal protein L29 [Patescibacteria group bacterium]MBU4016170.1 50S ribosomal protein L29 [Patescibacteria group bacterium]MBU4098793.1 50S ribosomal protein L29 [Patescibacteria group bacterium]
MKNKDKKELHTKTQNELLKLLNDARDSLVMLRLEKVQNKLKNTREIFNTRRKIAVILTILKEKEKIKNV